MHISTVVPHANDHVHRILVIVFCASSYQDITGWSEVTKNTFKLQMITVFPNYLSKLKKIVIFDEDAH